MNQDILERFVRVIAGNSLADTKADRRITVSVTVYTRHMVYSLYWRLEMTANLRSFR